MRGPATGLARDLTARHGIKDEGVRRLFSSMEGEARQAAGGRERAMTNGHRILVGIRPPPANPGGIPPFQKLMPNLQPISVVVFFGSYSSIKLPEVSGM